MTNRSATLESRRFGVEIEVEGLSTDQARGELNKTDSGTQGCSSG